MYKYLIILLISTILKADVVVSPNRCPQVLGCKCLDDSPLKIRCSGIALAKLAEIEHIIGKDVQLLEIVNINTNEIDFDAFSVFHKLEILNITHGNVHNLNSKQKQPSIRELTLNNIGIMRDHNAQICKLLQDMPSLEKMRLSGNQLTYFDCSLVVNVASRLQLLDLSKNSIKNVTIPPTIQTLNISDNQLEIFNISNFEQLKSLDISYNRLSKILPIKSSKLESLSIKGTTLPNQLEIECASLKHLRLDECDIRMIDFHRIRAPRLETFSGADLKQLQLVNGKMPANARDVVLTNTKIMKLPGNFFYTSLINKEKRIEITSTKFVCDACLMRWMIPVVDQMGTLMDKCKISIEDLSNKNCSIGITRKEQKRYGFYDEDAIITSLDYGDEEPMVSWYRYRPSQFIGSYDPKTNKVNMTEALIGRYWIEGSSLIIKKANRSHVERYVCVAENSYGKVYDVVKFRLDYTSWYSYHIFGSVFWGGLATSLIVCLVSFLLNITWILTRKSALWWIQRAERLSRVRKMVEAMEKYRARQMESLHDKYTKKVQVVRENYHQQVEALRVSYASQSEKFRDYRAAQMDAVSSHLENMRENYNAQLGRVRDYGSKRAEQLWESYERQVNRMRTFSLQHRLKLMRQYKVKQRYLNKLLESFQATTPDALEKEKQVREALEMPADVDISVADEPVRMPRASSFHSLPEYLIDERGNVKEAEAQFRFSQIGSGASTSSAVNNKDN